MLRCTRLLLSASLSLLLGAAPAYAGSLRCQSINGNLNCAGSDGVSCQTVNGHTNCTGAHGDVLQSFGGAQPSMPDDDDGDDDLAPLMRTPGMRAPLVQAPPAPAQPSAATHARPDTSRLAAGQN